MSVHRNAAPALWFAPTTSFVRVGLSIISLAVVGASILFVFHPFPAASPAQTAEILTVGRGDITSTITASGSVVAIHQAKLAFANSGRVRDILVNVGDRVTAGQPLADLVSDTAWNRLDAAKSDLVTAQLKLQQLTEAAVPDDLAAAKAAHDAAVLKLNDLLAGPSDVDMLAAQAALSQAQASADDADAKLQTLLSGGSSADRAGAQAGLVGAENSLAAAHAKLDQLQAGPIPADVVSAQSAVADANSNLKSAQAKLDQTEAGATDADLTAAQAAFDRAEADVANASLKLAQTKASQTLQPEVIQAQSTLAGAESKLHTAHQNTDQLSAQLEQANADLAGQLTGLRASIKAADDTCGKLGGSSGECATARASSDARQPGILKAQQTVKLLSGDGSWDHLQAHKDLIAAQSAVDAAAAALKQAEYAHHAGVDLMGAQTGYDTALSALTSARAKLDQTRSGATRADLAVAQTAVDQASDGLATAQAKLEQTLQGPADADVVAAQTAAQTAQANVDAAQAKLDSLSMAPPQDVQSARSGQASANAGLQSAQAKLAQLQAGPTEADVAAARSAVAATLATLTSRSGGARPSDVGLQQQAVRQAELTVQQAQIDLDNNTLRAPFDGVVASVSGNVGETAPSGINGFISVVAPNDVRIDLTVDETDIPKVAIGNVVSLTVDALPTRQFSGTVIAMSPSGIVSQGVVTYPVSVNADTRNQTPPVGLTASATIIVDQKFDAVVVPLRAVRREGRGEVVDLVGEDGTTTTRVVATGVRNDLLVEITDGVQAGEQIAAQGATR